MRYCHELDDTMARPACRRTSSRCSKRAPTTGRVRLEHRLSKVVGQWHCHSAIKATAPRPDWPQNRLRLALRASLRYHSPLSGGFTWGIPDKWRWASRANKTGRIGVLRDGRRNHDFIKAKAGKSGGRSHGDARRFSASLVAVQS